MCIGLVHFSLIVSGFMLITTVVILRTDENLEIDMVELDKTKKAFRFFGIATVLLVIIEAIYWLPQWF